LEYEFRANPDGSDTFVGYSAVFNQDSEPLPFIETIDPAAFNRTLTAPSRKQFVVNHDDGKLISSTATGRLRLSADETGLLVESPMGKTSWASDVRQLADDGELWGMSFSFRASKNGEEWSPDYTRRRLTDVELFHTTILTGHEPAYHGTSGRLQVRSLAEQLHASPEDVQALIDALTEGRALTPEQVDLLANYPKVGSEPADDSATDPEPAERLLDKWRATLEPKARP
jgi:HK97 family phage prohead protease